MNITVSDWYSDCLYELSEYFEVGYDDLEIEWILIYNFLLPEVFLQEESPLLITTPGANIENFSGYDFYMDLDLTRMDGNQQKHLIEQSNYNNLNHLDFVKLSYHLRSFNPRNPASSGDTIFDICQSIYHFLGKRW